MSFNLTIENNGKEIKIKSTSGTVPVGIFSIGGHQDGSAYLAGTCLFPNGLSISGSTSHPADYHAPPEPIGG